MKEVESLLKERVCWSDDGDEDEDKEEGERTKCLKDAPAVALNWIMRTKTRKEVIPG